MATKSYILYYMWTATNFIIEGRMRLGCRLCTIVLVECFMSTFYFALVVLQNWNVDMCSQNPGRVIKAQQGRQTPRIPYFTCQRHGQEIPANCAFKKCWYFIGARRKIWNCEPATRSWPCVTEQNFMWLIQNGSFKTTSSQLAQLTFLVSVTTAACVVLRLLCFLDKRW